MLFKLMQERFTVTKGILKDLYFIAEFNGDEILMGDILEYVEGVWREKSLTQAAGGVPKEERDLVGDFYWELLGAEDKKKEIESPEGGLDRRKKHYGRKIYKTKKIIAKGSSIQGRGRNMGVYVVEGKRQDVQHIINDLMNGKRFGDIGDDEEEDDENESGDEEDDEEAMFTEDSEDGSGSEDDDDSSDDEHNHEGDDGDSRPPRFNPSRRRQNTRLFGSQCV
eukprot:TRINITY_DN3670_c0_g3_i6.p2 TRINITY_DN3670_c0_g3~~TRINITY_DN3670_c0_g3_i6.p2  ORF type:complete len:223 (-),score=54.82 TRINITY_DN3670_c0_g3_i6:1272-1940(-)